MIDVNITLCISWLWILCPWSSRFSLHLLYCICLLPRLNFFCSFSINPAPCHCCRAPEVFQWWLWTTHASKSFSSCFALHLASALTYTGLTKPDDKCEFYCKLKPLNHLITPVLTIITKHACSWNKFIDKYGGVFPEEWIYTALFNWRNYIFLLMK